MSEIEKPDSPIVAYKGFSKDFKCRNFKYEVGKTYEHKGHVEVCSSGFHSCENPFDVWGYYGPFEARYAVVHLSGELDKSNNDSKIASAKITIQAELTLPDFITKAVQWVIDSCKPKSDELEDFARIGSSGHSARIGSSGHFAQIGSSGDSARIGSSGDSAQIGSSGYSAQIGSSGYSAQIGSSGYSARIGSSGDFAQIGSSGYSARIGSSGHSARIGSSGHFAQIGSSGHFAQIGSSGYSARIGSSGESARIESQGEKAVIACAGMGAIVSAKAGAAIAVPYRDKTNQIRFATAVVGEKGIRPGVPYRLNSDGQFVEAT